MLLADSRASIVRHILKPVAILFAFAAISSFVLAQDWSNYGADQDGSRYSPLSQINIENVAKLKAVWTYHTGALDVRGPLTRASAFEATPILAQGNLYLSTPFDVVIALDPGTGKELWKFDPHINQSGYGAFATSRGVAYWSDRDFKGQSATCGSRVFVGTLDATLVALDASTGKPCQDFGKSGIVDLTDGVDFRKDIEYEVTSAPTVIGDVVVVGSSIQDNQAVDSEYGVVRGYDSRSGKLLWSWDPIPWAKRQRIRTGAANAWSTITADPKLGLVFVPTGSASPDYYGALRPGDNKYADSLVALDAASGKLVWGFQAIHHDIWDYDVASQPLLFTFRDKVPAVAVATKTGSVFVLDRRTGTPLYPIEERPVPRSDIPGENPSATQPFSSLPALNPQELRPDQAWGDTAENQRFCQDQLAALRYDGMFTPPSLKGTLLFPGNVGGVNWGSTAIDPKTGVLYANTNRYAFRVQLVPRERIDVKESWFSRLIHSLRYLLSRIFRFFWPRRTAELSSFKPARVGGNRFTGELSRQSGTPYYVRREPILSHDGLPCTPQPWGALSALNLNTGKSEWEAPLGTMIAGRKTGSVNLGGPIVTGGGLVFTAATVEPLLRAFDARNGTEIWEGRLPAPAFATPMTYSFHGKQYVVVSAGGNGLLGTALSDSVVAFALN